MRIYIDALDECGQDIALDLVEFFRCHTALISICFACRHYPFVALEGGKEVCVESENRQDIKIYVQDKIEAHIQRTDIANTIRSEVVSRSQGNFQWVVLVMARVLASYRSRKPIAAIRTMIRSVPTQLGELYTELLGRIDEYERAQSLRFMQWICFACKPLTLRELQVALAIRPDTSHTSIHQCQNSEFYVETDEDMKARVYDLFKGLAEVLKYNRMSIVQFVHQSVQDFLLETGFQMLDNSIAGTVVGRSHFWLSRSCIKYLSMEEVQDFALSLLHMNKSELARVEKKDCFALLRYSVLFWLQHTREVENAGIPQDDLVALSFKATGDTLHSRFDTYKELEPWMEIYLRSNSMSLLEIASENNLVSVVKAILTQTAWADHTNQICQITLSLAAREGHEDVVKLLLKRDDVDANHKDVFGNTPLSLAAAGGREAVVEVLVNRDGVDVNSENKEGDTPFSEAVWVGTEQ